MPAEGLTKKSALRRNEPVWAAAPRISVRRSVHPLRRDYDVVIVGSGISGALMADALCDGRRHVLLCDRRRPVKGSTLASTAMIQHEIDTPLSKLAGMIGRENAERAWRRSAKSVRALERLIVRRDIACSFERKQTLYLAGDEYGGRALSAEHEARRAAGLKADYLKREDLLERFGIDRTAAIVSDVSASANPAQITAGLLRRLVESGALELCSPLVVRDVMPFGESVALSLGEDGKLVSAGAAIFCTGFEFLKPLQSENHDIVSTWALASRPRVETPAWLKDFLVWEGADPYVYFRKDASGRIILGGEDEDGDEDFKSAAKMRSKVATLRAKLKDLIGVDIGAPEYSWAAPFGATKTGLPLIGEVPGLENIYAVMGFGGNGITFSKIAAEIISAEIRGRSDADADLFSFTQR